MTPSIFFDRYLNGMSGIFPISTCFRNRRDSEEELLGMYRNKDLQNGVILFSTHALYHLTSIEYRLAYSAVDVVENTVIDGEKATDKPGLNLFYDEGGYFLPVDGFDGKFYDVFFIHRYLRAVVRR